MSAQDSAQLYLSPNQQDLLMAALNSNQSSPPARKSSKKAMTTTDGHQRNGSASLANALNGQTDLFGSPAQSAHGSGHFEFGTDEGPYLDFDLDAEGEVGFNFDDEGQMIGDIPGDNSGNDEHQKRKSIPDDEEDDEGGGKRREGDDKSGKKPGRKPLTSEPTSVSPNMISARRLHTNFR
jgi:AP-1-like factor